MSLNEYRVCALCGIRKKLSNFVGDNLVCKKCATKPSEPDISLVSDVPAMYVPVYQED